MWIFRPAVSMFAATLGVTLAGSLAHANPHHPMSVLEERISQLEEQINTLRASQNARSPQEQPNLAAEIYELVRRLSYLEASKIHLQDRPEEERVAFIEYVNGNVASPSRPVFRLNNGFGNGNQDAPGGSEFNNNAENAGGNN